MNMSLLENTSVVSSLVTSLVILFFSDKMPKGVGNKGKGKAK